MLEVINTDAEIFNLLIYGVEGVNYTLDAEGKVSVIENMGTGIQAWVIGNQCNALLSVGQADDTWEVTDRMNREADVSPLISFAVSNANVQEAVAAVSAAKAEYKNWEYEDDYAERYEEYIEKIREPQMQILAEYQAQLDAWLAAQK